MFIYDHIKYSMRGVIDLADKLSLEETARVIYQEFVAGNILVNESEGKFNQVSADMALEPMDKVCKVAGIVSIT